MVAARFGIWLAVVAACVAFCVVAVADDSASEEQGAASSSVEIAHVLRIDSAVRGVAAEFEGSVAYRGKEGTFQLLSGTTPFEVKLASPVGSVIGHATIPDAPVSVSVTRFVDGESHDSGAGTGRTVVAMWGSESGGSFITVWE